MSLMSDDVREGALDAAEVEQPADEHDDRDDAPRSTTAPTGAGAAGPSSAQRKPSMTPAIGFSR